MTAEDEFEPPLTELEQRQRDLTPEQFKQQCRAALKRWLKTPAGLLAVTRYKRINWGSKRGSLSK